MSPLDEQWQRLRLGADREPFPDLPTRKERLRRLAHLLTSNEQAFCDAVNADYGYRSAKQTRFADITTTLKAIRHARLNLRYWMTPQRRSTDVNLAITGASTQIRYYPKGVVGIVSPWNFPLNLSLSPLASILAAGNRAFLKPSEITPATSSLLSELITETFDDSEVAVACGGVDVAERFVELPFNHLIYTGSTAVGRKIAERCASNLTPLTLELGGKCPVVVSDSADLKRVAQRLIFGKQFNAGQICIAPDRVLLPTSSLNALLKAIEGFEHTIAQTQAQGDHVEIVTDRHRARLDALVEDAERHHASVVTLGNNSVRLVINPMAGARILTEEIFGPVLLLQTTSNFADTLKALRQQSPPLAIYYFGSNRNEWQQLNEKCPAGALVHNDIIMQYANDDLPFGGVGDSGLGHYRGVFGFREFSNLRACYEAGLIDVSRLTSPPYPPLFHALNNLMRHL